MINNNKTHWSQSAVRLGVLMVLVALPFVAGNASADNGAFSPLTNNALVLFGLGLLVLFVGAVFHLAKMTKWALPTLVIGGLLLAIGGGGFLLGALTNGGNGGDFGDLPPPPGGYVADWECAVADMTTSAQGDAHDAITEFPDSPFVAADAGTPDLNKVVAVPTLDLQNRRYYYDIAIDDDLASSAAAYIATDAHSQDINCKLLNPTPAVGGGLQEIPFWGRLTPSRTAGTANNGSYAPVFYCDTTGGYYLGWGANADSGAVAASHTADHTYSSYTRTNACPSPAPLSGDWVPLGTSDGDSDGEWVSVWFVLDNGLSDYTAPPIGSSVDVLIEIGTQPGNPTYDGDLSTYTMSIRIDTRT
jgi:hypothetical protein